MPADIPVTMPVPEATVAMVAEPLLHDPPESGSLSVIDAPGQTDAGPVIAGVVVIRFTVSIDVTLVGHPNTLVTV